MEALGWMYSYACNALDKGKDIRQMEVPELLEAFHKDIDAQPKDSADTKQISSKEYWKGYKAHRSAHPGTGRR